MNPEIQKILVDIAISLLSLLGVVITYYVTKLVTKIQIETAKIKDEKQRKLVEDAINRVNSLVNSTVAKIEQTVAKDLRQAVADGKVDKAELLALGQQAVDEVYMQLSEDTKKLLADQLTDVDAFIRSLVEAQVLFIKM
jgi:vacuolar-type H+-ATPase subunit H